LTKKKHDYESFGEIFEGIFKNMPKGQPRSGPAISYSTIPPWMSSPRSFPIAIATAFCNAASGFYKALADSLERWAIMQHEEARTVREYQMRAAQEELERQMRAEHQAKEVTQATQPS